MFRLDLMSVCADKTHVVPRGLTVFVRLWALEVHVASLALPHDCVTAAFVDRSVACLFN